MPLGTTYGNAILNSLCNAAAFTPPVGELFVGLHTADPTVTGTVGELSGNGYARVAASFGAAASKSCANDAAVTFAAATGSDWAEATHFSVWDAIAGTYVGSGALSTAKTVTVGDIAEFAIGALVLTA